MHAIEVTHGSQLVEDRPVVEVGELPCVVVHIGNSERIQIFQHIGAVDAPEGLGGGQPVQHGRVLVPETGLRVGDPHEGLPVKSDRRRDLGSIVEPHVPVIGRGSAQSRPEGGKAVQFLIALDPVAEAGVVLADAVEADAHDCEKEDAAFRADDPLSPLALCLGIFGAVGLIGRKLRPLGEEQVKERKAG